MIAALYIDPRGPYPKMAEVDCWDETRDARLYDGPHAIVAHPPCTNVPPGIKVCSAQQRRRTPPAFAEWLVMLARSVRK